MTLNELWTELDELERAVEDKAVACQLNLDADVIDIHRRDAECSRGTVERAFKSLLARAEAAEAELAALHKSIPWDATGVEIKLGDYVHDGPGLREGEVFGFQVQTGVESSLLIRDNRAGCAGVWWAPACQVWKVGD